MKTIAIIGATFSGNRGAEAMVSTTIYLLTEKFPQCSFAVFSYYPKNDRRIVHHPKIKIYSCTPFMLVFILLPFSTLLVGLKLIKAGWMKRFFPANIKALYDCKMLIDLAGVSFIDGREKFLPFNILTLYPALIFGIPVVKCSQAMGPFNGFFNRICAKIILPRCHAIFARGQKTYEHLASLGLKEKVKKSADVAFLHSEKMSFTDGNSDYVSSLIRSINSAPGEKPLIGICPSAVLMRSLGKRYFVMIRQLIVLLSQHDYRILLFPHATRSGATSLRNNDLPVIAQLAESLKDVESIIPVNSDINAVEIKQLISKCDVVLVSRFHAMIGALTLAIPPVVLGWSHKYHEVMQDFEMGNNVFHFDEITSDMLFCSLKEAVKQKVDLQAKILENLPSVQRSSRAQFDLITDYLAS